MRKVKLIIHETYQGKRKSEDVFAASPLFCYNKPKEGDQMRKKVFSLMPFILSCMVLIALTFLTFEMIADYHYINSSPSASGVDYLGLLIYRPIYCFIALSGMATSAISYNISGNKVIEIISVVLLTIFATVFVVFGAAWLRFI